jgi:hypothetical protein
MDDQQCAARPNKGNPQLKTHYVLIDYENVQPKDLASLKDGSFKVKVFVGPNQGKISIGMAMALQALGSSAEYILLEAVGRNALDFHIAYYIGTLSAKEPLAVFHVISKDTGFDSLIKHLAGKGIVVHRSASITGMSTPPLVPPLESQVCAAVTDLIRRASSRPRTKKTLLSTLHALFRRQLSEQELLSLLDELCRQGVVRIDGAKVTYELPPVGESGGGAV